MYNDFKKTSSTKIKVVDKGVVFFLIYVSQSNNF